MRTSPIIVALLLLFAGCGATKQRPLFSFGDSTPTRPTPRQPPPAPLPATQPPPSPQPIVLRPAAQPLQADPATIASPSATREEIEVLIARLRGGRTGERKLVLDRLVALGDTARADLERAMED